MNDFTEEHKAEIREWVKENRCSDYWQEKFAAWNPETKTIPVDTWNDFWEHEIMLEHGRFCVEEY